MSEIGLPKLEKLHQNLRKGTEKFRNQFSLVNERLADISEMTAFQRCQFYQDLAQEEGQNANIVIAAIAYSFVTLPPAQKTVIRKSMDLLNFVNKNAKERTIKMLYFVATDPHGYSQKQIEEICADQMDPPFLLFPFESIKSSSAFKRIYWKEFELSKEQRYDIAHTDAQSLPELCEGLDPQPTVRLDCKTMKLRLTPHLDEGGKLSGAKAYQKYLEKLFADVAQKYKSRYIIDKGVENAQ